MGRARAVCRGWAICPGHPSSCVSVPNSHSAGQATFLGVGGRLGKFSDSRGNLSCPHHLLFPPCSQTRLRKRGDFIVISSSTSRDGGPERLRDLPKDTQLASVQGRICTRDCGYCLPIYTSLPTLGACQGQVLRAKVSSMPGIPQLWAWPAGRGLVEGFDLCQAKSMKLNKGAGQDPRNYLYPEGTVGGDLSPWPPRSTLCAPVNIRRPCGAAGPYHLPLDWSRLCPPSRFLAPTGTRPGCLHTCLVPGGSTRR